MSPIGGIGALSVVGLRRAGVSFCGLGEGGEAAAQARGAQAGVFLRLRKMRADVRRLGGLSGFLSQGVPKLRWALRSGGTGGRIREGLAEAAGRRG